MENLENTPFDNAQPAGNETVNGHPEVPVAEEAYRPAEETYSPEEPREPEGWDVYREPFPPRKPKTAKVKKERVPASGRGWKTVVAVIAAACVLGGSILGTAAIVNSQWEKRAESMEKTFQSKLNILQQELEDVRLSGGNAISGSPVASEGLTPSQVYNRNVRSVVAISNQATVNYFGQVSETASSGSGFILSEDGFVVTNYHVVEGANKLSVITYDGTEYPAELVGYESNNDLAVLKINATELPAVTIGSSDALIIGDMVVAIGNPLGELTSTQTVGYLSAKDRNISTDGATNINMMQTDAAINPGNSGGPLFNMNGEVVGITTAKYSGTTNSGASIEGIGFAIPIDDVIGMVEDIIEYGYVTGSYLGVSVREMDEEVAQTYGLPMGVQVVEVLPGYCAEKAGVQAGDLIIGLGGFEVENYSELSRALRQYNAGDETTLTVYRSGRELTLTVTLDAKPEPETETETEVPEATESTGESWFPGSGDFESWEDMFEYYFGGGR